MNLEDIFEYDPLSGILRWKVRLSNRVKIGDIAGTDNGRGYLRVGVDGKDYVAHRIAWEIVHGKIPEGMQIDHINSVRNDNRISNLRLVTHLDNVKNQKRHCTNTSGVAGVSWNKDREKWCAYINVEGKRKHIGLYDCIENAIAKRKQAERKLRYHDLHGNK